MSATTSMPEQIGRFHIRSMLGRGAMGVVYLGHDEQIDRLVAIKLIRADLLDTEEREGYLKRFSNEAKIAGRCMHANIVGLYDFALHDENPYLVMEYVDGIGLQQFFPKGTKLPVDQVIHIALQVLDALHYAHGRSIVHRDIKPANILMMPDLSLKITDFGISRLTSMELTVTPLLIGTPSYMSPEQCLGSALDGRNDLFSLGCVLYELLAGERAFSGVNYTDTIFAIVNKPHTPLSQLRDDLPPGLSDAIDMALAKSPEQRHPDAASFARVLDEIARAAGMLRPGMPTLIADSPRIAPTHSPLGSTAGQDWSEDPQPTISARLMQTLARTIGIKTQAASTPKPITESDEDPDATLRIVPPSVAPQQHASSRSEPASPPIASEAQSIETSQHVADTPSAETSPTIPADDTDESTVSLTRPDIDVALDHPPSDDTASLSFVPGPHYALPVPVGQEDRRRIVDCLTTVIGPIAPLLAKRTEEDGMSADDLAGQLARQIQRADDRTLFQDLLRREGIDTAGHAA